MSDSNVLNLEFNNSFYDSISKEKMNVDEYYEIPPVPFQRFTEGRAKSPKVKKSLSSLRPEHLDVQLAELTEDSEYFGTHYRKNSVFIINGNTRKYFWQNNMTDMAPSFVFVTRYKFKTMEEMRKSYDTFDSMDAVERNQEKVFGYFVRVHNFEPKCSKLQKGEIVCGLNFASTIFDPSMFNQPNIKPENLAPQIGVFIEEIKAFDKICKNPKSWDQALFSAAILSFKLYGTNNERLLECLDQIDRRAMNTMEAERDGATHIVDEWVKNSRFPNKTTTWNKPGGLKETVSFAVYWINRYVENKKLKQLASNWKTTLDTLFIEYYKTKNFPNNMNNIFNIV